MWNLTIGKLICSSNYISLKLDFLKLVFLNEEIGISHTFEMQMNLIKIFFKRNFLLRKIFRRNLNEAVSLAEIDETLKVTSMSINEIASFRFPRKIFLKRKVTYNIVNGTY